MKAVAQMMSKRQKEEAKPFTTRALREVERLEKKKSYAYCLIKIVFPDRWALQAKFLPSDSIETIMRFVAEHLQEPVEGISLAEPPRRQALPPSSTLKDLGLVPAARLLLSSRAGEPQIRQSLKDGASSTQDAMQHIRRE